MSGDRRQAVGASIVALLLLCRTQPTVEAQTVVRRADIERAGWNRVTEILEGATGWGRSSVDGFTFAASPDHLPAAGESAPGTAEWLVLVDGQRVPHQMLGMHLLELLPVSIGQVDSVVFTRGPTIVGGTPVARGVMSIFTRRLSPGANAQLSYQHGDETGDPGPYRYTSRSSPNVEKLGPFVHASVGWGGAAWDVDAGAHLTSLNVTDERIAARFRPGEFAQLRPDVRAITPTFRARAAALGGRHELQASYGDQRGLLFIPTQRIEQSLHLTSAYLGMSGSLGAPASTVITYEGSVSNANASEIRSPLNISAIHKRRHSGGVVAVSHSIGRGRATVGAIGDQWTFERSVGRSSRPVNGGGPLARWHVPIGSNASLDANATLVFDGRRAGTLDASVESLWHSDSLTRLTLRAGHMTTHPDMDGTWVDAALLDFPLAKRLPTFTALGIAVDRRLNPRLSAGIEVRGEHVSNWGVLGAEVVPVNERPIQGINLFTTHFRLETVGDSPWRGVIDFEHGGLTRTASDALEERIASTPANELRAELSVTPVRDLRLSGILNLIGGTRIEDGNGLGVAPGIRRLDASAEKWMWRRRFRLALVYRNLLNRVERYHPYGAQWNLRWHALAALSLPH